MQVYKADRLQYIKSINIYKLDNEMKRLIYRDPTQIRKCQEH